MIPGNEKRVIRLMNQIANCGTSIKLGSVEGLHTSGHAFSGELQEVRNPAARLGDCSPSGRVVAFVLENICHADGRKSGARSLSAECRSIGWFDRVLFMQVMNLTGPQHFLPVHGEVAFLKAHEQLARQQGIHHTAVIQNGTMIGCGHRRSGKEFSTTRVPLSVVPDTWTGGYVPPADFEEPVVAAPDTDTVASKAADLEAGIDQALCPSDLLVLGEVRPSSHQMAVEGRRWPASLNRARGIGQCGRCHCTGCTTTATTVRATRRSYIWRNA